MIPSTPRVRFAPSPTGYLHVGGARTALFNWLYARKLGGAFLLRIEDTDRERSSDENTKVILDGLTWLGLDWDEDVVFQGTGLARHQALAKRLIGTEHTYEDDGAVRFRMPRETIAWDDLIHGPISFEGSNVKDWIILRSDGTPTYNFSVVADDIEMRMTHVVRGDDHISNTPKQIAVYRALGVDPPAFGHVPLIHRTDGAKLSKRHGAVAVGDYRLEGLLPAAMRNFLALLGWNPGDDRELFYSTDELLEAFSLDAVQVKAAIFDPKKLEWMNGQHITHLPPDQLFDLARDPLVAEYGLDPASYDRDRIDRILDVVKHRARRGHDLARMTAVRLEPRFIVRDAKAEKLIAKDLDGFRAGLRVATDRLAEIAPDEWTADSLDTALRAAAEAAEIGVGKIMQPIRIAVTGGTVSESVDELLCVVGKDESLRRIGAAMEWEPASAV